MVEICKHVLGMQPDSSTHDQLSDNLDKKPHVRLGMQSSGVEEGAIGPAGRTWISGTGQRTGNIASTEGQWMCDLASRIWEVKFPVADKVSYDSAPGMLHRGGFASRSTQ